MVIAISLDPFRFVLKCDRDAPDDEKTTFIIRRLSASENAQIEDAVRYSASQSSAARGDLDISVSQSPGTTAVEQCRVGLSGWENFKDAEGNQVEFLPSLEGERTCNYKNLDKLTPEFRHELANAIDQGGSLSEEDAKN